MEKETETEPLKSLKQKSNKGPFLGVRHLQAVLLFLNIIVSLNHRFNVSVGIVAMTNAAKSNADFPEYDWNEKQKSYVLSSFFWGYTFTLIPASYWTRRYGVKINLLISQLGTAISSLIVPWSVSWGGWAAYSGIRLLQGVMMGMLFPTLMQHLAKWSPPAERTRLGGFVISGYDFGTTVAMALSGLIAESSWGWPGLFYAASILGAIWCGLWFVLGANDAASSKIITPNERAYIESSLLESGENEKASIPIPWRAILTSKPFYALFIADCAHGWSFFTLVSELPSYMNGVLDLNIKENALYTALIFLVSGLTTYVFVFAADVILKRKWMSLTIVRKSFNSFSMWLPAAGLVWFGYLEKEQKTFAIILMSLIIAINAGSIIGINLNTIDLSPNHAGILAGLINTGRSVASLLAPLFVGFVVTDETSRSQWQLVFNVAAFVFCAGDAAFFIFGSAQQQPWNAPDFLQVKGEFEPEGILNAVAVLNGEEKAEVHPQSKSTQNFSSNSAVKAEKFDNNEIEITKL